MAPHVSNRVRVKNTTYVSILTVKEAFKGEKYAIRLRGQNLTWRVMARGFAGDEQLATGTIALGSLATVRVSGLPETIGAARLDIEARLSTAGAAVDTLVEASWVPIGGCSCELSGDVHPDRTGACCA